MGHAALIAFWRLRQGGPKFKTSLAYKESSKISQAAEIVRAVPQGHATQPNLRMSEGYTLQFPDKRRGSGVWRVKPGAQS